MTEGKRPPIPPSPTPPGLVPLEPPQLLRSKSPSKDPHLHSIIQMLEITKKDVACPTPSQSSALEKSVSMENVDGMN